MRSVLVTGGCGFIGSHMCKFLLKNNFIVYCVDNLSTGFLKNIKDIIDHENFIFINHDVQYPLNVKVDQIYHLASPASPKMYQQNGIKTLQTNFLGTYNMLELASKHKATILLASTSEIYGDPEKSPQKETYYGNVNCFGERSCYDEGKRVSESLMYEFHKNKYVDIRIARIFNTYGPNMNHDDGRVIPNFITSCIKNENIKIYGDGSQTRSFCYVDDMVRGLYQLMNTMFINYPVNLGNDKEISINQLATIISTKFGKSDNFVYTYTQKDDPKLRRPCLEKAKNIINYEPKVCLEEGLGKTIRYFSLLK